MIPRNPLDLLYAKSKELTNIYLGQCMMVGVDDVSTVLDIYEGCISERKHSAKNPRQQHAREEFEKRWYDSLSGGQDPDWGVYSADEYLGEAWACWIYYSRGYLKSILSSLSTITEAVGGIRSVVDLGCGIGYTTAALRGIFPDAKVYGTNLAETKQMKITEMMGRVFGFETRERPEDVPGEVDFVLASEYFEHFQEPILHLGEVLSATKPKAIAMANSFGARSVGHFDTYKDGGNDRSPGQISKAFSSALSGRGYRKFLSFWNGRPSIWANGGGR